MMRAMLDIETLAVTEDALVTAVGICLFNEAEVVRTDCITLDITADTEGHIDPATIRWWLTQDTQVFRDMMTGTVKPGEALDWIDERLHGRQVWANGPQFDCTILRNWIFRQGGTCPWNFRDERDMRTMYALGRTLGVEYPVIETRAHDAGADAYRQALHLLQIEAKVRELAA